MRNLLLCVVLFVCCCHIGTVEAIETVLLNGQSSDWSIETLAANDRNALVRWGNPAPVTSSLQVLLTDGSFLVPSQNWSSAGAIKFDVKGLQIAHQGKTITIPRSAIAAVQMQPRLAASVNDLLSIPPPADIGSRDDTTEEREDQVTLVDGDLLKGNIKAIDGEQLLLELYGETVQLPLERLATLRFGNGNKNKQLERSASNLIGLSDGSLITAASVNLSADRYQIRTETNLQLEGEAKELVFFQPANRSLIYLSDQEPLDYQHTPYFTLRWPYGRDRLPVEGRLKAKGRYFAKGISMHTASRLVYRLESNLERFQASLALYEGAMEDSNAPSTEDLQKGSALFKVFVVEANGIRPLYESPIVRTGDTPIPIDLDVKGGRALVLTVDYADGADVGDDCLWLDARFVLADSITN